MNFRDAEQLSAYLDQQLSAADARHLEARLAVDEVLGRLLEDLRVSRDLLRRVPRRGAPRNFALSPLDARVRAPRPLAVPVLRFSGALASLLFLFSVAVNSLVPLAARTAASAPAYGMGGGMGGGAPEIEMTAETMLAAPAGMPGIESAAPAQELPAPSEDAAAKAAPADEPPAVEGPLAAQTQRDVQPPIPALWLLILPAVAVVLLILSWYLDRLTRRLFKSRVLSK